MLTIGYRIPSKLAHKTPSNPPQPFPPSPYFRNVCYPYRLWWQIVYVVGIQRKTGTPQDNDRKHGLYVRYHLQLISNLTRRIKFDDRSQ